MSDEARSETKTSDSKPRRMPKKRKKASASKKNSSNKKHQETKTDSQERYLCVHCGHRFRDEQQPKRCPSCLRKGGLETLEEKAGHSRPWLIPVAAMLGIALLAGGYILWHRQTPDAVSGEVPLRPLGFSELRGYLRENDADGQHAQLFETGDAINALRESITGNSNAEKATSLTEAIRARGAVRAFVSWPLDTPRSTPIYKAEEAAALLSEDENEAKLYPLEVALIAVSALREEGVDAMIAEIWKYPGDRRPPDPSGFLGYFGFAVYDGDVGEGQPLLFDPYGGHTTQPERDHFRVLDDTQVVAAFMGIQAAYDLVHENDTVQALRLSRNALRVDGRAPYLRTIQGKILVAGAGVQQGIEELQAASQIRSDAPRRNNVAGVFVVMNDVDQAGREVAAAIEEFPDFASAHATLAAIHLAHSESEQAREELTIAERLEPQLMMLPMLWAQYHFQNGDSETAALKAAQAVERNPNNWETRFQAARLYRMIGHYDAMRREARQILELVNADQELAVRERIAQLLGPTALEEEDDLTEWDEELEDEEFGDTELGTSRLQLGSSLLGNDDESSGPSLLDEDLSGGFDLGTGNGAGSTQGFQLGGGGGGLRLNFNE